MDPDNCNSDDGSGKNIVPFQPTEMDVVATKIRTWNSKHPGNQFYTDAVQATISNTPLDDPSHFREAAKDIYQLICVARGGRFLKLPEGHSTSSTCKVMSEHDIVNKVIHALKTAKKRKDLRDAGIIPPPFTKAAQVGLQPFKVSPKRKKVKVEEGENVTEPGSTEKETSTPSGTPPKKKKKPPPSSAKRPTVDNDTPSSSTNNTTNRRTPKKTQGCL